MTVLKPLLYFKLHALKASYICLARYPWPAGAQARRVCMKECTGMYNLSELVQGLQPEQGKDSTVEMQLQHQVLTCV